MSANQFTSTYANLVHRIEKQINKTYQNCVSCVLNNYLEWISNTNSIIKPKDRFLTEIYNITLHSKQPKREGGFKKKKTIEGALSEWETGTMWCNIISTSTKLSHQGADQGRINSLLWVGNWDPSQSYFHVLATCLDWFRQVITISWNFDLNQNLFLLIKI